MFGKCFALLCFWIELSFCWTLEGLSLESRPKTDSPLGFLTKARRSNLVPKSRQSLSSFKIALTKRHAKSNSRCRYIAALKPTPHPYSRKKNKNKAKKRKNSAAYLAKAFDPNCLRPELKFEYKKKRKFTSWVWAIYLSVFSTFCQFVLAFSNFFKYFMKFDMGYLFLVLLKERKRRRWLGIDCVLKKNRKGNYPPFQGGNKWVVWECTSHDESEAKWSLF